MYVNEVMEHFKTCMVPSILALQKASSTHDKAELVKTGIQCVRQLISLANSLPDKTMVSTINNYVAV